MSVSQPSDLSRPARILSQFTAFRSHLDAHTDKRERLIKLSRDITALSKRLIFTLHRSEWSLQQHQSPALVAPSSSSHSPPSNAAPSENAMAVDGDAAAGGAAKASILSDRFSEARQKDLEIRSLFEKVGQEFKDEGEFWLYERNVSGGLQEYIEAISFQYWLENAGGLISLREVQSRLSNAEGRPYFPVTTSDYILGLSDLSGELMRYTINAIGLGKHDEALKTVEFVRELKAHFDVMTSIPNLWKKNEVTAQSLHKIENAAYQVALRRQEFAGREDVLGEMVRRGLAVDEGFSGGPLSDTTSGESGGTERKRKPEGDGRLGKGGRGGKK